MSRPALLLCLALSIPGLTGCETMTKVLFKAATNDKVIDFAKKKYAEQKAKKAAARAEEASLVGYEDID